MDHYPGEHIGGGEEYLLIVAEGLKKIGCVVAVVCMPQSGLERELRKRGLKAIPLSFFIPSLPLAIAKLKNVFESEKPDIVNTHGFFSNIVGRLAAKKAGIERIYCTIHTEINPSAANFLKRWEHFLRNWIEKSTSRGVGYIAVSSALKEQLKAIGIEEKCIEVISPGLSQNFINFSEKVFKSRDYGEMKRVRFGSCGRLEKVKDYPTLLRAFSLLLKSGMDAELIIFGSGSQEGNIRSLIKRMGLKDRVHLRGYRDDSLFLDIDIFCSSSLSEGFNISLLKAQACGIPAVATSAGGQKEIVLNGKTGFLVKPRSHEEMKKAMEEIIKDKGRLKAFSRAARENAIKFTEDEVIIRHAKVFGV